jgi:hypothetical protein
MVWVITTPPKSLVSMFEAIIRLILDPFSQCLRKARNLENGWWLLGDHVSRWKLPAWRVLTYLGQGLPF